MATMKELLEKDKERFMQSASKAENAQQMMKETERQLSRILYIFNEEEQSEKVKAAAYRMIQTVSSVTSFLDCSGRTKIYGKTEYTDGKLKKKHSPLFYVFLLLSVILFGVIVMLAVVNKETEAFFRSHLSIVLLAAACMISCLLTGLAGAKKDRNKEELVAETTCDANKVWLGMYQAVVMIDKLLDDVRTEEENEKKKEMREKGVMADDELELMASLLENAYTDPENPASEDMISHIRFYLHNHLVDVVNYSAQDRAWFDMMPAKDTGTIRPALVSEGRLLKKGLAAGGI